MEKKRILRSLITLGLLVALGIVLVVSGNYDAANPHASVSRERWLNGPEGHGYAVLNNQQPQKQCLPCHEKKGLGGKSYCLDCHVKSGVKAEIPNL